MNKNLELFLIVFAAIAIGGYAALVGALATAGAR